MIVLKSQKDIEEMREGGTVLAHILQNVALSAFPGKSTKELDALSEKLIVESGASLAFKGYEGFPGVLCTAVNEEGVHVPPSARKLQEGDILTLDMGLKWKGWYLDMAKTIPIGSISKEKQRLLDVTKKSLELAIEKANTRNTLGDIGCAIQEFAEAEGYQVVREMCGHGIGRELHEDPRVLNYGKRGAGLELVEGMVICIEPMVVVGDWHLERGQDGWSFNPKDGSLFCHFEDTVAITKEGPFVLTRAS